MTVDTGLAINPKLVHFLKGQRFNRTSFFKALHNLSVLEENSRGDAYCEIQTYTYTGKVCLYEKEKYNYTIKVENASGYVEIDQSNISLTYLLQSMCFSNDQESVIKQKES